VMTRDPPNMAIYALVNQSFINRSSNQELFMSVLFPHDALSIIDLSEAQCMSQRITCVQIDSFATSV
jgi:hypothetical protein